MSEIMFITIKPHHLTKKLL